MSESLLRMLAAIMFTDMVGYTAMMQEDESKAKKLRDRLRQVIHQCAGQHGGRILQFYGDGVLCSFASTIEATFCALKIQKALREEPKVPARIGIHEGDVAFEAEGIYGDSVNVASRIQELAVPGGICISEKVYDEIRNQSAIKATSLGKVSLKNVRRPIEIFALTGDNLASPKEGNLVREELPRGFFTPDRYRIAVLPLENFSPDPHDEYFSDGMTEELISRLSRVPELRVIARTSVMQYKGTRKTVVQIGRELNVGTVLEGSVRKSNGKLRITEQLIDAESEEHLWSEDYDREDKDVFAIQSEIAQHVVDKLRVQLLSGEKRELKKQATENLDAFDQYLKGRFCWNKRSSEELERGIEYFNLAIERDPAYALPYAGLADSYILLAGYGYMPPSEALQRAGAAARKAVELDDTIAESHTSVAAIAFHYCDWETTEAELKRAIELNPSYATAHHWYAVALAALGRFDEAIASERKALELDPLDPVINTYLGWIHYFARRYDEALEQYWRTLEMNPGFYLAYLWMGQAYEQKGLHEGAVGSIQKAITLSKGSTLAKAVLGRVFAVSGREHDARAILRELNDLSRQRYVPAYYIATVYAGLGDNDHAVEFLEKAYEEHYLFFNWINVEPMFDLLRSDRRFGQLLKKMNFQK